MDEVLSRWAFSSFLNLVSRMLAIIPGMFAAGSVSVRLIYCCTFYWSSSSQMDWHVPRDWRDSRSYVSHRVR